MSSSAKHISCCSKLWVLPLEVLTHCLANLGASDVLSCKNVRPPIVQCPTLGSPRSQTCRRLFYLVNGDYNLQLVLEKMICHASLESCRYSLTSLEQLRRLGEREAAWRTLDTRHASAFSLVGVKSPVIMTGGGVVTFAADRSSDTDEGIPPCAVFESFTLPRPWSNISGVDGRRLILQSTPFLHVVSYATDPSQNLLIVVAYNGRDDGHGGLGYVFALGHVL